MLKRLLPGGRRSQSPLSRATAARGASAVLAALLATLAGCRPPRPLVVCLGDDVTAGYSVSPASAYPALLQARLDAAGRNYHVVNAGIPGATAAEGLNRADEALEGDVRVLVLALGTTDGLQAVPVEHMKRDLHGVIRRARERGIAVLLVGARPPRRRGPEYVTAFTGAFESLAREHPIAFVPDLMTGVSRQHLTDGVHPDAAGQEIVADAVWRALEPLLARQR